MHEKTNEEQVVKEYESEFVFDEKDQKQFINIAKPMLKDLAKKACEEKDAPSIKLLKNVCEKINPAMVEDLNKISSQKYENIGDSFDDLDISKPSFYIDALKFSKGDERKKILTKKAINALKTSKKSMIKYEYEIVPDKKLSNKLREYYENIKNKIIIDGISKKEQIEKIIKSFPIIKKESLEKELEESCKNSIFFFLRYKTNVIKNFEVNEQNHIKSKDFLNNDNEKLLDFFKHFFDCYYWNVICFYSCNYCINSK